MPLSAIVHRTVENMMKTVLRLLVVLLPAAVIFISCKKAPDPISIPDDNFLQALKEQGVDTNGDGLISNSEAEDVTELDVTNWDIQDLSGIESFIHLEFLDCSKNLLTSLDISALADLQSLSCSANQLSELDVSLNRNLVNLNINFNQISNLRLSSNPKLKNLRGMSNQIDNLDLTANTELTGLGLRNNPLPFLDISNNRKLEYISLEELPLLMDVCVWTVPFPPEGVTVWTDGSPNINFTTECSN